jgi:serine/threonine protein kinase
VKPLNILLRKGPPVLVDFGLAVSAGDAGLTRTGQSAGYTGAFAAPEQIRRGQIDTRSDVYSLAGSLYYALAYGKSQQREPDLFDPSLVPQELRELLTAALNTNPARRPKDAGVFRQELRNTLPASKPGPQTIAVSIPGHWVAKPRHDPDAEWKDVCQTPGIVIIHQEEVYGIKVNLKVSDDQLAILVNLHDHIALHFLSLQWCDQITDGVWRICRN